MEEIVKDPQTVQGGPVSGEKSKKKFTAPKKAKKWLKILVVLVIVAAVVAGCVANAAKKANDQMNSSYLVSQAVRQDLTLSVTGTATLKPADSYNVTTLISGEIESAPFEEGDLVSKGDLLFTMDSGDAQNNVERANISVSQAQLAYQQAKEGLSPVATISGTINELYVHNGDNVTAGSPIAKIVSSMDLSVDFLFPYAKSTDFYVGQPATVYAGNFDAPVSGTVESVSNSASVTSNGLSAISVRVKIPNPGVLSDSMTATAQIGSYGSYGQTPLNLGGASTVYATASGTVLADNLPVNPFHLFPTWKSYASPTLAGPFAQLTTAAIDAGIARAALDDTVAFVRHSARPWIDAGVAQASDDPLTIYHIGQLDSRLAAADALLERAGRVLDRYKNDLSEEHVAEASLAVARAKIWTTEVALEAASRLFELGGTRATGESLNLDRHWRNARVHTLHDPVRWKYQLLGNWVLNGIRPQRHDWN